METRGHGETQRRIHSVSQFLAVWKVAILNCNWVVLGNSTKMTKIVRVQLPCYWPSRLFLFNFNSINPVYENETPAAGTCYLLTLYFFL